MNYCYNNQNSLNRKTCARTTEHRESFDLDHIWLAQNIVTRRNTADRQRIHVFIFVQWKSFFMVQWITDDNDECRIRQCGGRKRENRRRGGGNAALIVFVEIFPLMVQKKVR